MGDKLKRLRETGLRSFAFNEMRELATRLNPFRQGPLAFVYLDDAMTVDWAEAHDFNSFDAGVGPYKIAWVISPPGRTSGGHQNAFRFMKVMEDAGHHLTVYFYSPAKLPVVNTNAITRMMQETSAYPELKAEFKVYEPESGIQGEYDAIFACDWGTAYAAYRYSGKAKRFYFAQDFEPDFFPAGTDYILAENTYRMGFHAITAGRWLAKKLTRDYGMSAGFYDYGVDSEKYFYKNEARRNEVLFYARPPTARRATEFGLICLAELHRQRPDIVINLVGWDMSGYDVPFPYVNNTALDISQLNDVYNRCAAAVIFSMTNLSLLPMEVMGAGAVPIVNDGENTRGVLDSPYVEFMQMSPGTIVQKIIDIVDDKKQKSHAERIARSVAATEWANPAVQFLESFMREMSRKKRR